MGNKDLRTLLESSQEKIKEKDAKEAYLKFVYEFNHAVSYENYANICEKLKKVFPDKKKCQEALPSDCWEENLAVLTTSVTTCFYELEGKSSNTGCQHDNVPLLKAVCDQDYPKVKELLSKGGSMNDKNSNGENALHLAVKTNNNAIATLLFKDFSFNVNTVDNNNTNPLMLAVISGNLTLINAMDRYSSFVNYDYRNGDFQTPLHLALENNHPDIAQYLLDKNVSAETIDNKGNTPLHLAAKINSYSMVRKLLDKYASTDPKNDDGKTPIDLTTDSRIKQLIESRR